MGLLRTVAGALVGDAIGRRSGHGLLGAGLGILATRIAARSLPGAAVIGGALVAKSIYDKRKERRLPSTSPSANIPSLPPANP